MLYYTYFNGNTLEHGQIFFIIYVIVITYIWGRVYIVSRKQSKVLSSFQYDYDIIKEPDYSSYH